MNENIKKGFGYGILATFAMSVVMIIGVLTKIAPMPAPIPVALAKLVLGSAPKPALFSSGMFFHFLYGGIAGIIFMKLFNKRNIVNSLLYSSILWLLMQVIVLPILGWGFFGINITPKIAVATLILHSIYGLTLGWLFIRSNQKRGIKNEN